MPIYEYRCLDCGHQFELMQKFSDPPAETCMSCSGTVQKLISRSAFHLKGSGWYVTDYGIVMAKLRARMTQRAVQRVATKKARVRVVDLPAQRLPAQNLRKAPQHLQPCSSYVSLGEGRTSMHDPPSFFPLNSMPFGSLDVHEC